MDWDSPIVDEEMWREGCVKTLHCVIVTMLIGLAAVGVGL